MATAPAADQLKLLEVAELDSQIARLERDNVKHPLREKLATLMNAIAARGRETEAAGEAVKAAQAELAQAEAACEAFQSQITDKEAKLASGEGLTSRDLVALQEEIAGLRTLLDKASDVEFEALDSVEDKQTQADNLAGQVANLKDEMLRDRSELEDVVGEIQGQQEELGTQRASILDPLSDDLKKIYEHSRESGGYAVLAMHPSGATDGGIHLSPVEVAQIRALPEDQIYLSEDYDAIIVRLPN
ncbi:MAG: zinc ribbon domain-containing protein [Ancrocorticia sp.]|uniref:zinc ribbon domain-containing protein n=1 Tax=Ancrocorticia sp. TaxID=2593684 RepID=UPI003F9044DB